MTMKTTNLNFYNSYNILKSVTRKRKEEEKNGKKNVFTYLYI